MSEFNINAAEIQNCVENMACVTTLKSFYPESISRKLGVPLEMTMIELGKLCEDGKLILKYEIKCLEDMHILATVDDYEKKLGSYIGCDVCGEEIIVDYSNIYPVYYISEEYREFVKKNFIKNIKM